MAAAVEKTLQSKLEDSRQATQQRLVRSLREYRNLFSVQNRTSNRLIYPESLKLLPLYTLGILKNVALRGGFGDCSPDERSAMGFELMTMSIPRLLKLLYPSLLRLDEYLIQVIPCVIFSFMSLANRDWSHLAGSVMVGCTTCAVEKYDDRTQAS
jgi:protein transport protein SEC24